MLLPLTFLLGLCLTVAEELVIRSVAPPPSIKTLADFHKFLPQQAIVRISVRDQVYYVVWGEYPLERVTWVLFENRPGYLFSESGELLAWSSDADNVDEYSEFWNAALGGEHFTYDEIVNSAGAAGINKFHPTR